MAFGFKSLGAAGGTIFDTNDPSYGLYASGSVTTVLASGWYGATITLPSSDSILFVRCSTPVMLYCNDSNVVTMISPYDQATVIDYKIFAPMRSLTLSGAMGLETYDASGDLVFSSLGAPLILRYVGTAMRSDSGFSTTHSVAGAYVCASPFCSSKLSVVGYIPGPELYQIARWGFMCMCNDTTVSAAHSIFFVASFPAPISRADLLDGATVPILITT